MLKKTLLIFFCLLFISLTFAAEVQAPENSIFRFEKNSMTVLLSWGAASAAAGVAMLRSGSAFVRGVGVQSIAWGIIDAGLALGLKAWAADKEKKGTGAEQEALRMANIFLINFFLDILYLLAGILMIIMGSQTIKGHGAGIVLQGLFLFAFDGINYLMVTNF